LSHNLTQKQQSVIKEIFQHLKPKPKSNALEFAKKYGYLSPESSAVQGRFVPFAYQEDMLRDMSDDDIELIVFMKSTRIGFTKLVNFKVAYNIAEDPATILVFQPNDGKANEWAKDELKPLIRDMPIVNEKIIKTREDDTLKKKAFFGGYVSARGGTAVSNYASATARDVVFDEYDRYPDDIEGEGDPYALGVKRVESYWNSKVIIGSTPKIKYHSKTEDKFHETDMRYRYLPCPHCNHMQILVFKNLDIPQEYREGVKHWHTDKAKFICIKCEEFIDHKDKRRMDKKGKWLQTQIFFCCDEWQKPKENRHWYYNEDDKEDKKNGEALCKHCGLTAEYNRKGRKKRGYHIWAGYSFQPNTTWTKIAEAFVEAIGNLEKMKSFRNTWLGETFEEKNVSLKPNLIMEQAEDYKNIPNDTKVILMTVDNQNDRLEYLITAWCMGETSYNIKAGKIWGDPINRSVWDELKRIAEEPLCKEDGTKAYIYKSFIDMGGQRDTYVKKFVRANKKKFMMLKGDSHERKSDPNRPVSMLKISEKEKDVIMWVATNKAKDIMFERLTKQSHEYGFIHHNKTFKEEWYNQLGAEKKVFKKNKSGRVESTYINTASDKRNEATDLVGYQIAAVRLIQNEIKGFDLSIKE